MASIRKRPDRPKPWEAVYRDPAGRQRTRSFARKVDAQRFLTMVEADLLRGTYVDPDAGKVTFAEHAERWLASLTTSARTREGAASHLRAQLLPVFGDLELRAIRPSVVQQWLSAASRTLAPSYVRLLLSTLSAILGAAVEDGVIVRNPCASRAVRAPRPEERPVDAWTPERVGAVGAAMTDRYAALVPVGVGLGLRQGEALGLPVDNVDFLRREVHVRQQVKHVNGGQVFDLPKRGKTRTVPLSDAVAVALAEHLRRFPPVEVTLPWREVGGDPTTLGLVFTNTARGPVNRGAFNDRVWKPALVAAGVEPTRENGYHVLRHTYASTQLQAGVSVPAVAKYLGHADGGALLLRTYAHVMPQAPDQARAAVDAFLRSCEPDVSQGAGS